MNFLFTVLIFSLSALGSHFVEIDNHEITLADQERREHSTFIGTIIVETPKEFTICFETEVFHGSGGDVKIIGPNTCIGPANKNLIDLALEKSFKIN